MPTREERLALNQAMFRIANERISEWPERQGGDPADPAAYYCECSRTKCRERLSLTHDEYEAVRADSRRFAIVPGHEYPDIERVVAERRSHAVVEKAEALAAVVQASDPRRP